MQDHLRPSSYAVTADVYSHVGPAQAREAADRLDQAIQWCALLCAPALLYRFLRRTSEAGPRLR